MKIVFTAYVIDPNGGSEGGNAWAWVEQSIANGMQVTLVTTKKWSEKVSQIYGYEIPKNLEILVVDTAIIRLPLPYQIK